MKIGIIGNGFVGNATMQLKCKDIDVMAYDLNPELCIPKNTTLEDMLDCEIIFVSVPTPTDLACNGVDPKISPNSALLFLKPLEPTLAILFDVVEISVCAPLRPVSAV